ncbi:MAG: NAD(P)H-hydrate dehydratase, partial [Clostridium sp.]
AVVEEIEQARVDKGRVLILCGTGNNGADGAAIARMLYLNQWDVTILTVGKNDNRTEEMKSQLAIDDNLGIPIMEFFDFIPGTYDVTVDALFGVGLTRELSGEFKEAVEMVGQLQPKLTVAVDIPSGIHSETGHVMGIAFRADLTVTFGYAKLGTLLYPGKEYSGRIAVRDIGFPEYKENWKHRFYCYDEEDLAFIPSRKPNSHKGMYGKVLIAAGSRGMCGAAYLSALAAYRTGAGLVKILSVEDNVNILQTLLPEAIISSYSPQMEEEEPELFRELIEKECAWAGVIVLGPGLGTGRHVVKLVEYVLLSAYVPIILDADGLNAVAEHPHLADFFTENVIVTPHMGEMSRLLEKEIEEIK